MTSSRLLVFLNNVVIIINEIKRETIHETKVRKLLMVSPFKKINSDFISIMNGDDEGIILKLFVC